MKIPKHFCSSALPLTLVKGGVLGGFLVLLVCCGFNSDLRGSLLLVPMQGLIYPTELPLVKVLQFRSSLEGEGL